MLAVDGRPRLLIHDDHRLVAEGLRRLLQDEYDVVALTAQRDELWAALKRWMPAGVLLDLIVPGGNGIELLPCLRKDFPLVRVLVVTMLLDRGVANAVLSLGAHGYVPKDVDGDELHLAVAEVLAGRNYVSPRVPKTSHGVGLSAEHRALHRLTPRQQQIVLLHGEGKCASEIAAQLGLSPSTITFHKHNIERVLGLETEAGFLKFAVLVAAETGQVH